MLYSFLAWTALSTALSSLQYAFELLSVAYLMLEFHLVLNILSNTQISDVIVDYDMSRKMFSIVQQDDVRGVSSEPTLSSSTDAVDTFYGHHAQNDKAKEGPNIELQGWKDFSDAYCCERKEVISYDGVRVPLTIVYSKKTWRKSLSPGLLQGYGAYGEVLDKSWCADRLTLLDRGWVVAFADVRLVLSSFSQIDWTELAHVKF